MIGVCWRKSSENWNLLVFPLSFPFFFGGGSENFRELRLHFFFSLFDFEDLKFVRDVFTGTYGEVCESN